MALASCRDAAKLPDLNLITGIVAVDGDAKRSPIATAFKVPENIRRYIRSLQSYSEFSTSLKGLRSLVFATIPTDKQNIMRSFGDGTELALYHRGWVTLSGLSCEDSTPTIEHRQDVLDRIIAELWPDLNVEIGNIKERASAAAAPIHEWELDPCIACKLAEQLWS